MIIGKPDFSDLTFTINDAVFRYGSFITAVITFVAIAAAVFFFVVKPMDAIKARTRRPRRRPSPTRSAATRSCSPRFAGSAARKVGNYRVRAVTETNPYVCARFTLEEAEHGRFVFPDHGLYGFGPIESQLLASIGEPRRLDPFEEPAQLPVSAPPRRRVPRRHLVAPQQPDPVGDVGLVRIRLETGRGHPNRPTRFQDTKEGG